MKKVRGYDVRKVKRVVTCFARVFPEASGKPVAVEFFTDADVIRPGDYYSVAMTLEDAAELGRRLFSRDWHFIPWRGDLFGWVAFLPRVLRD